MTTDKSDTLKIYPDDRDGHLQEIYALRRELSALRQASAERHRPPVECTCQYYCGSLHEESCPLYALRSESAEPVAKQAAQLFYRGTISAGKFGEMLGLDSGELHDFKSACGAFDAVAQPAHIPTDAEAIEAEQLSEASAEPVAASVVMKIWREIFPKEEHTAQALVFARRLLSLNTRHPTAQPAPTDGPTPEQIEYMAGDYLSAAMTDKVHLGVLQEVMEGPSPPQPAPVVSAKLCSTDGKPCPAPLAGKGRGESQCEQNGMCQRVSIDALPTLRASVNEGKLSLRVEPVPVVPDMVMVSRSLAQRTTAMFVSVDPDGSIANEWQNVLATEQEKSK